MRKSGTKKFRLKLGLLIDKIYNQILVFTDSDLLYRKPLVQVGMQYLKELDQQYPGSKFILNTCNKETWLESKDRPDDNVAL